ncbi:Phosphoenolpyruvate synthase [Nitrospira sp. KM1]|uniref:PEP/pyruvate-binding domain-containing protein n=1 Tax=Nitrospira sp. KM1 TaxID=1936990 RepID=UPI0013A75694|nr:PEP/pyruvate-binding domain-containing protein [Nitrospira sp. KM1]BCA55640.1 Phosphoenolpyruvate synthase [Nitrospira sp. KM1]
MTRPLILPLTDCTDPALAGGKAAGLGRLLAAGFPVPPALCLTTLVHREALMRSGFDADVCWLDACRVEGEERLAKLRTGRSAVSALDYGPIVAICREAMTFHRLTSEAGWAVRSSATVEDAGDASFAGLFSTRLGVQSKDLAAAIRDVWSSLWDERVLQYVRARGAGGRPPGMAVVIQPMVAADAAGVMYSMHPVTGRSRHILINAIPGLAAPLVDGRAAPDQYVVQVDDAGKPVLVRSAVISEKSRKLSVDQNGLHTDSLTAKRARSGTLSEGQLFGLAEMAKEIEKALGCPVDVEWAFASERLRILQARPITGIVPTVATTNDDCEWTRANFRETMPEVPSPLGISFLEHFMDMYIMSHYRRLGCRVPEGISAVRVLHGRPYLNASLFHCLIGQLRGDPSMNIEQLGGEAVLDPLPTKPIGWAAYARAGWLMWKEMKLVDRMGPVWFAEMRAMASDYNLERIRQWTAEELSRALDRLGRWLDTREVTFGIAAAVGQCLQTFSVLLPAWLGPDWRTLFNAALQGQGTVISANQIVQLAGIVDVARQDRSLVQTIATLQCDIRTVRCQFPAHPFLSAFDRYMEDYGHRGVGESDVMSPRFRDQPDAVLAVIRSQLNGPAARPEEILTRQRTTRAEALKAIQKRIGWRLDRQVIFQWWYRRLCRFFSLREENRHHLMRYSTAARALLLRLGERFVERGVLEMSDDIFFLTLDEREALSAFVDREWKSIVRSRRSEHARQWAVSVPDTIRDWGKQSPVGPSADDSIRDGVLHGLPISVGLSTGPARLIRSMADWIHVKPGDVIVAPVIDPGMAPLFGIASGLIVEMGGTLSHGAIIAREYGIPTVANVGDIMSRLRDGDIITVNASMGEIILQSEMPLSVAEPKGPRLSST